VVAIAILSALAAVVLILIGVLIADVGHIMEAKREQAAFSANADENLKIISAMQTIQNRQNAMLLRQVREARRSLPAPEDDDAIDALLIDDSIFSELEN